MHEVEMSEEREEAGGDKSGQEFLMVASGIMALLFAALLVLVYVFFNSPKPPVVAVNGPVARECDEKADKCGAGSVCVGGECVVVIRPACASGQGCNDGKCSCSPSQVCVDNACAAQPRSSCADPELRKKIKALVVSCEAVGGHLLDCPASEWQKFAISNEAFDALMANFANAIAIHFPLALPEIDDRIHPWPDASIRSFYRTQLEQHRKSFDEAKAIFVVGRASKGGSVSDNQKFGQKRLQFATSLLRSLYKDGAVQEIDKLNGKLKYVALGSARQLPASFFSDHFQGRMLAWTAEEQARLEQDVKNAGAIEAKELWWTANTINQVAFLVPLPCDGSEAE